MNNSFGETYKPQPISVAEQVHIDRQMFDRELAARDERKSHAILTIISYAVDERYSWLRTTDPIERAKLAGGIAAIRDEQRAGFIEKGEYPTGPQIYRTLQRDHLTNPDAKHAVLLAEAMMGGDTRKGAIPILAEQGY